jgi:hypothetical protein
MLADTTQMFVPNREIRCHRKRKSTLPQAGANFRRRPLRAARTHSAAGVYHTRGKIRSHNHTLESALNVAGCHIKRPPRCRTQCVCFLELTRICPYQPCATKIIPRYRRQSQSYRAHAETTTRRSGSFPQPITKGNYYVPEISCKRLYCSSHRYGNGHGCVSRPRRPFVACFA